MKFMPEDWALQLVKAGVRMSYARLLAAADSMVSGVEVWVLAQQLLGMQTDIPPAAIAACCLMYYTCRSARTYQVNTRALQKLNKQCCDSNWVHVVDNQDCRQ
jgi:hypothetical protein